MDTFLSFLEFVSVRGLDISNAEKRTEARQLYRKEYKAHYYNISKNNTKRVNLTLSNAQYQFFIKKSSEHDYKSLSKFILDTSEAYLNKEYLNPNKDELQKLILILRSVGNNINQIARYFNQGVYTAHSFNQDILFSMVNRMEDKIVEFISHQYLIKSDLKNKNGDSHDY